MSIRVGLGIPAPGSPDPFEAWVLDRPGCFATGRDEHSALAALPASIERYLAIVDGAGAGPLPRPSGSVEVVERFQCFWHGTYEVSAFFASDADSVGEWEVAFARALLSATRERLLDAAGRATPWRAGERSVGEVLHHVANAEWFYGSRLAADPEAVRSFGYGGDPDPLKRLKLVRAWALERIAKLPSLDDLERTHSGERWTARKVIRRYIYHELEHLWELEARA